LGLENKRKLIDILKNHGKVIITSEKTLDEEFEKYRMSVSPTKMHDLLYYTDLFISEGATMVSECAVLGTQTIYVNSLDAGTLKEQEKLGLIYSLRKDDILISLVQELIEKNKLDKQIARELSKEKLADKIDVTQYILDLIEND